MEEGNFSDWTIYDTQDDPDVGSPYYGDVFAIFNTEETIALFYHDEFVKKYDVAAKSLSSSLLDPYYYTGLGAGLFSYITSAYGKYVVFLDDAMDKIHICKDGAIAKDLTNTDLGVPGVNLRNVSISPTGKYVVVVAPNKWIILEGS